MDSKKLKNDLDGDNQANNSGSGNRNTRKQMVNPPATKSKERVIKQIKALDMKKLKDLGIESNILSALTKFNIKGNLTLAKETVTSVHELPSTSNNSSNVVLPSNPIVLSNVKMPVKSPMKKIETTKMLFSPRKKVKIVSDIVIQSSTKNDHEIAKIFPHTSVNQAIETESNGETTLATDKNQISTRSSPIILMSTVTQPNHIEDAESIEDSFDGFTDTDLYHAISQLNDSKSSTIPSSQTPYYKRKLDEQEKSNLKRRKTKDDTPVESMDVRVDQNLGISKATPLQLTEEGMKYDKFVVNTFTKKNKKNVRFPFSVIETPLTITAVVDQPKPDQMKASETPARSQRGRKPKQTLMKNYFSVRNNDLNKSENEIIPNTSVANESIPETSISMNETETKRRGRPPKKQPTDDKMQTKIINTPSAYFICGNCKENIDQKKWKAHEATHYGVTWREGVDDAIEIDDQAIANRLMTKFMKATKLPYFRCPKCSEKKKSALGYISHVEFCGLTKEECAALKAECPYCKKLYRKVSLPSHMQGFCPVRRLETIQQQSDETIKELCGVPTYDETEEVIYTESGRPKRIIKKVKTPSRTAEEFIKVGLKITGGVMKGWNGQLAENGFIKCPNNKCSFKAKAIDEMRTHFADCRDKILQCKLCSLVFGAKEDITQHIEKEHEDILKAQESEPEEDKTEDDDFKAPNRSGSSDSDDDSYKDADDDFTEEKKRIRRSLVIPSKPGKPGKRKRTIPLSRFMANDSPEYWEMLQIFYTRIVNARPGYYRIAEDWTKKFVEMHYNQNALELNCHLRNTVDYVRLTPREIVKYLNTLESESVKFACKIQTEYNGPVPEVDDDAWITLNQLDSTNLNHLSFETSIFYCGGKIMHIDWIPLPSDYVGNQILITCSHNKNAKLFSSTNCMPTEKNCSLIQLWSVSTKAENEIENVKFLYGIAYDDGPIFTMAICPSDAYVASKRLSIVAIPDTNGHINILSLPEMQSKTKNNTSNIIKLKPEMRLQLTFERAEKPQTITQLTWSRTKGHKVLCAGFNTGLVAVWNFEHLKSGYMRKQIDGIPVLLPKYSFLGALSCITQLDLHADKNGTARWLLVGAIDRKIRLYDLEDPTLTPFTSTLFKSRIISGAWPLHWPIYLTVIDAALTCLGGGINIKQVLYTNNQSQSTSLLNDCEPSNLAFSDWLNTAIFGNDVGDLFIINFQQLLLHDRCDEAELKILSVTDIVPEQQINNENNDQSTEQMIPRIIFSDYEDTILAPKLKMRIAPPERYPFTKINKVSINSNESHKKMYAIGYELGFCRIRFLP